MTEPTIPPAAPGTEPPHAADDFPVESGKQILINWIIVALGLGAMGVLGAVIPEFL
ncbi:hypothetical protein [Cypionkella sp.]|uniref:hypothetical protein n=1 Tax=Cypionkella sp. TaxID=2811411 RepID=UPI002AB9A3DD|nr:hypothetical protein [Cypionkella sp.]MDZ4391641.1 hypothetical protein [Cypionkella sp.]